MIAPKIDFSDREERIAFIKDRFSCKAPACGGCGSCLRLPPSHLGNSSELDCARFGVGCHMPNGKSAMETFADYIDGKVEFVTINSKLWQK